MIRRIRSPSQFPFFSPGFTHGKFDYWYPGLGKVIPSAPARERVIRPVTGGGGGGVGGRAGCGEEGGEWNECSDALSLSLEELGSPELSSPEEGSWLEE